MDRSENTTRSRNACFGGQEQTIAFASPTAAVLPLQINLS
jgi:hypothetical protein